MNILPRISEVLYHGTIDLFSKVDVAKGRGNKDFGKGFYMAVDKNQALGMMEKKFREAVRRSRNKDSKYFSKVLYEIRLDKNVLPDLKIKYFFEPDMDWINFVIECRRNSNYSHVYDLVIGPTADDNTTLCFKNYFDGMYSNSRTDEEAREFLLKNLETDNLGIQYFIGKQEIADRLISSIKIIN